MGGGQASQLGKVDFEIWVEGEGQDTSRNFWGGFGFMRLKMTEIFPLEGHAPKWQLGYFGRMLRGMKFTFVLPIIYLENDAMGKPILKSIGLNLAILSHENLQKTTKMAVSQNACFPKCFPKWPSVKWPSVKSLRLGL